MEPTGKKIVYVVNVDWFFISHRLPLALHALAIGYKVYVITKDTGRFAEMEAIGLKCIPLDFERSGRNPVKEFKLIFHLKKIYLHLIPDIIHHITLKPSIYGTTAARKAKSKAIIINAVSGLGYTFTGNRISVSKMILVGLMRIAFLKKTSRFIFQNPDDRAFYEKQHFLNASNNLIIKGSGVDENVFVQKNYEITSGKIRVVLVARMLKDKGILEFIRAAESLQTKYADKIEFILVGGLDLHNPAHITQKEIESHTKGGLIKWMGHRTDVKEIYTSADIVCLPSYREGLPKSLVEAMAIGCPIITTDTIGCRDCVDEGVNGYLVPVGNHVLLAQRIETLALDRELRIQMGNHSRLKMVKEMSLSQVIKMTFELYA